MMHIMHLKKIIISRVVVLAASCMVMISLNVVAIEAFTAPSNLRTIRLAQHSSTIYRLRLQQSSLPCLLQAPIVTEHEDNNIQSNQIDGIMEQQKAISQEKEEEVPSTWKQALHRFFLGEIGPPLVVLSISGFIYARIQLLLSSVPFTLSEFAIFLSAIIFWSFQEYFLHRVALHSQHFNWIGKSIHQTHHDKNYFHVSIDPPILLLGWLFAAHLIIKTIMPSWHLCLSATIGYALSGLVYEWSHYIVHTKVKAPQSSSRIMTKLFLQMRNNHMRHHLVDKGNWYAFSVPAMDDLFDTNPDVRDARKRENAKRETKEGFQ